MLKKVLLVLVLVPLGLGTFLFWLAYLSPRPPLTTEPTTLAGDGSRTVVTSSGIIHDYGPNSTAGLNTDDTEGSVLFTIGDNEFCMRTSASMIWEQGVLNFHAFGWGPVVVKRYMEDEQLLWEYADGSTTQMDRICTLPEELKVPGPRGKRYSVF